MMPKRFGGQTFHWRREVLPDERLRCGGRFRRDDAEILHFMIDTSRMRVDAIR